MNEAGDCVSALFSDDLRDLVFNHWNLLNRLAERRFRDPNTADEALMFALQALQANDWQKVREYKGKSPFPSFFSHVVVRLLEDFSRNRYGRKRPPQWLQLQGILWEDAYRLLCLERMSRTDTIEMLVARNKTAQVRMIVEEAVEVILSRTPDCGEQRGVQVSMDHDGLENSIFEENSSEHHSPEALYIARQQNSIFEALRRCFLSEDGEVQEEECSQEDEKIRQTIMNLDAHLRLTGKDRLLLRMVYRDGLKTVAAGRLLGMGTDQVHGRLRRLLNNIRQALEKCSLDKELLLLLRH